MRPTTDARETPTAARPALESLFTADHDPVHFTRLRRRIAAGLVALYLAPLVLLALLFEHYYTRNQEKTLTTHLRSVAENKRNAVSLFLQERVANARSAFRFDEPPSTEAMARLLAGLRRESEAFVDVGLFDNRGLLVAYAGEFPKLVGKDYSEQPWFRALRGGKRDYTISDVYLGFRDRPHFVVAVRRRRASGEAWVLRASVDPERFSRFVRRSLLLEGSEALVLNRRGVCQTTGAEQGRVVGEEAPAPTPITRVETLEVGGRRYLAALAWLDEVDWAVVVRVPARVVEAPVRAARFSLAGVALFAAAVIVLLALRGTRRIVGKLEREHRAKQGFQRQLFSAAKLASVGEMAAGVAHEINNPLAVIYEEAAFMRDVLDPELAAQQPLDVDDFRERLGAIMATAIRGRKVTGELLAFARQHDDEPAEVVVNEVIAAALAMKERSLTTAAIEVEEQLADGLPAVWINANRLEQVLLNLVNNAKDAIGRSGRIAVRSRRGPEGRVVIEVQDDGCGMSAEQLERIFFPFYTTKAVGKGTGLGLSISYGIIRAAGGQLEVESKKGEGSTFRVILPPAVAQPEADSAEPDTK